MSDRPNDMFTCFKKRFKSLKILGKGAFGGVFEVVDLID